MSLSVYFRKYQSFVDQQDTMISLHILLRRKIDSKLYPSCLLDKFCEKMKSRTIAHLDEFRKLQSKLNERRKYLEQKIKDKHLKENEDVKGYESGSSGKSSDNEDSTDPDLSITVDNNVLLSYLTYL